MHDGPDEGRNDPVESDDVGAGMAGIVTYSTLDDPIEAVPLAERSCIVKLPCELLDVTENDK